MGECAVELRPYQEKAKAAVYEHLRTRDDNPCVVIPTAGGKTPLLAMICKDAVNLWNGRVLILAHVKELLEQAADKLQTICPEIHFGVYSAGLRRRDTKHRVILAGIQSVYKRACELDAFDLIIVDEAHLIQPEGEGMYRMFLRDAKIINPHVRVIGLTATPFRLKSGMICGPENILNDVCYEVGLRELIRDGFLCPLVTKAGKVKAETSGLHVRAGEFVSDEVESLMDQDQLIEEACAEIVECTQNRHAVLIFASSVKHGRHIVAHLRQKHGVECGFIAGDTPTKQRDELLERFRDGKLKYLANINVLTTGFDAPNIDCVAILRPTMSPGLFYQMVGRGFRLFPGKKDCLVLDFGGNVLRHGPVDQIQIKENSPHGGGEAPAKECPQCRALIAAGYARCPQCGYAFPPPERQQHEAKATDAGILSGQITDTEYEVRDVVYGVHTKRGATEDVPKTMRVEYRIGLDRWQNEFLCFEHDGFARQKAVLWWKQHSPDPTPDTVEQAVEIAKSGGVAHTDAIVIRHIAGDKYDRIIGYRIGPMPEPIAICDVTHEDLDDIPF
jgi:DNA repair protein RadD